MLDYISNSDTIKFSPDFNNKLDLELVSNYKKIIFSDYLLKDELFDFL
jgi:hypothetical protein